MPSHSSSSHSSHSSHSSSSFHSSSSRSYSSSSSRSYSSRPSSHSSSSHSSASTWSSKPSRPNPAYSSYLPKGQAPYKSPRPRHNQPMGWVPAMHHGTRRIYYGVHHTYYYYPESWSNNGQTYNAGYYDENGDYYSDVSFKKDNEYENLTCHCDYCGTDTVVNWKSADTTTLTCGACGAPLTVKTQMDEMTAAPEDLEGEGVSASAVSAPARKRSSGIWKWIFIVIAALMVRSFISNMFIAPKEPISVVQSDNGGASAGSSNFSTIGNVLSNSNVKLFGSTLQLRKLGNNAYELLDANASSADKTLKWVNSEESYYDAESDCYLWYNTDVEPALWQYWYEGISSEYESGWMEYEDGKWYIETDWDNWVELPARYNADGLWHLE